jgi:hypothetical protein
MTGEGPDSALADLASVTPHAVLRALVTCLVDRASLYCLPLSFCLSLISFDRQCGRDTHS